MKRLITLTSIQGRTPDEVEQEMMEGMEKYRVAQVVAQQNLDAPDAQGRPSQAVAPDRDSS